MLCSRFSGRVNATIIPGISRAQFPTARFELPYGDMAIQIMAALDAGGDRVILRYDPQMHPDLAEAVRAKRRSRGRDVDDDVRNAQVRSDLRGAAHRRQCDRDAE